MRWVSELFGENEMKKIRRRIFRIVVDINVLDLLGIG